MQDISKSQIDFTKPVDCVVLVHLEFTGCRASRQDLHEFQELARSAGAKVATLVTGKRNAPDVKYFVGKGKVEEISAQVNIFQANLVIFNHDLSPTQERNLQQFLRCRVLDRTGLILDIFAQRARSFEGKLQVELAQLQHLATRLVRGWTHLERQKGGIGLRGPGEKQLETDRRLIRNRIVLIKKRLEKVRSQREQGRRARRRALLPTVALVGYTNAGKSTLFNKLSKAEVYVADKMFATLDSTLRRIKLKAIGSVILADTVGFVHNLPHDLIDAFRATLEETKDADLLLHVIDASDCGYKDKITAVNKVLERIGAHDVLQLQVYNKIDLLPNLTPRIDRSAEGNPMRVWIAAKDDLGLNLLLKAIEETLGGKLKTVEIELRPDAARLRAFLYENCIVISERTDTKGNQHLTLHLTEPIYQRIKREFGF